MQLDTEQSFLAQQINNGQEAFIPLAAVHSVGLFPRLFLTAALKVRQQFPSTSALMAPSPGELG